MAVEGTAKTFCICAAVLFTPFLLLKDALEFKNGVTHYRMSALKNVVGKSLDTLSSQNLFFSSSIFGTAPKFSELTVVGEDGVVRGAAFVYDSAVASLQIQHGVTNLINIFTKDFIPPGYETVDINGTVHICMVVYGYTIVSEFKTFMKSVLLHAIRRDLQFHFLASGDSAEELRELMGNIPGAFVNITFQIKVLNEHMIMEKLNKMQFKMYHRSGIAGVSRSFLYNIWTGVERCIVLDTDLVFGTDPAFLWSEFQTLAPAAVALVSFLDMDPYFSTGVMLEDFSRMREMNFENLFTTKNCDKRLNALIERPYYCGGGDQHIQNHVFRSNRSLYRPFPLSWHLINLPTFQYFRGFQFRNYTDDKGLFFGVAHFPFEGNLRGRRLKDAFYEYVVNGDFIRPRLKDYLQTLIRLPFNSFLIGQGRISEIVLEEIDEKEVKVGKISDNLDIRPNTVLESDKGFHSGSNNLHFVTSKTLETG